MARLSMAIVVAVFMIVILAVSGENKVVKKRDTIQIQIVQTDDVLQWFCQNSPFAVYFSICNQYTTTSSTSTPPSTSPAAGPSGPPTSSNILSTTTTSPPSNLQTAHWCSFANGSFIPLGYTFMYTSCALCQCTQSHSILCNTLQCMATYCIDNSIPSTRPGQCCSQCAYEVNSTSCVVNGISFPTGTIVRTTSDNIQCWCELGTIECRKTAVSSLSGLDLWGTGTAVYVIIVIVCALLIAGSLLCGGCTIFYYYYYYRNQQSIQQAYGEYWNNAGWQPMGEDGQAADAENKQAEAEQGQNEQQDYPTGNSEEYIPPPYALYNGAYANEQTEKDQRHV
jgi:hypothetical protein